jgi:hypothetical protein
VGSASSWHEPCAKVKVLGDRAVLKRWTGFWSPDIDIGGGSNNDPGAFTHGPGSALAGRMHVAIRQGNNAFDGFWAKYK